MTDKIEILDNVYAKAAKPLWDHIGACLYYKRKFVKQKQHGTEVKQEDASMLDRRSGKFLAGLLPRVMQYLRSQGVDFELAGMMEPMAPARPPTLKGITLRPEQQELIQQVNAYQRGVIKAPTGSGKTIMALGAISQWPDARVLILVHRKELLTQFADRIMAHMDRIHMQTIMEGCTKRIEAPLIVAMVQTLIKRDWQELYNRFDILIVDEVHHAVDEDSQLGTLITQNISPIKIGFTATPPDMVHDLNKALTLEGMIGPVIGDLSVKKGQELGIIAHPYVTLMGVPYNTDIAELRKYRDIYVAGVVENTARNAILTKAAKARAMAGLSSLTIIKEIDHGNRLVAMAERFGLTSIFIHGGTSADQRQAVKQALENKTHLNVIVTDIWREGVDIPTLDCVIIGAAPKSQIYTLQAVGRGMRTAEGKEWVEIVDFLDPYKYLARHCVGRLNMYKEGGWL
jgi:superfamily II DNA or RNA helicase